MNFATGIPRRVLKQPLKSANVLFNKAQGSCCNSPSSKNGCSLAVGSALSLASVHRAQTVLKREMEHTVIDSLKLWCPGVIGNQSERGNGNHELCPKGLINLAKLCYSRGKTVPPTWEEIRVNPGFSLAGRSLNWKGEKKLYQKNL